MSKIQILIAKVELAVRPVVCVILLRDGRDLIDTGFVAFLPSPDEELRDASSLAFLLTPRMVEDLEDLARRRVLSLANGKRGRQGEPLIDNDCKLLFDKLFHHWHLWRFDQNSSLLKQT
jgi:hypothetical protein